MLACSYKRDWEELFKLYDNLDMMQQLKVDKNHFSAWNKNYATGFSALPAGLAYDNVLGRKGDWAIFWASNSSGEHYAWSVEMDNFYPVLSGNSHLMLTNTYLKKMLFQFVA